jgi:aspartyl-tRNA(Asn)/glutamyl-tRNA(Gln) amidotransferase subunit A
MRRAVAKVFESFDVIASPARATVAYPTDKNFEDAYPGVSGGPALIPAGNLCGLPALSMPTGLGDNGLPTAIALMGPAFSELELVRLGNVYQQHTDWHLKKPPAV